MPMRLPFAPSCLATGVAIASLLVSLPASAVGSAELYSSASYFHGRYEARIQFAAGDGVVSSFFLWKSGSEQAGTFWNELDIEKLGATCLGYSSNAIYGNPSANHQQILTSTVDVCAGYHTHAFEWTPDYIRWLLDGVEVRRVTGVDVAAFETNATAGMQFHFNVWPGDASFGGNFSPSILPVYQYVNWVSYASYHPGAGDNGTDFKQEWREDFNQPGVPTGWAVGTWASPKNYSTHNPANVVIVDGKAVLALTADAATGYTGHPPVDPADTAGDAGTGGGTASDAGTAGGGGSDGGAVAAHGGAGGGSAGHAPTSTGATSTNANSGGGCALVRGPTYAGAAWGLVGIALLALRKRRACRVDPSGRTIRAREDRDVANPSD